MPKGAPNRNHSCDLIHFQHIEKQRSLTDAALLSPDVYLLDRVKGTFCPTARQRFNYLRIQFAQNQHNYNRIKRKTSLVITEDNSLLRAKEEEELLDEQLSYCSSQRDVDGEAASLSTTTTFVSPIKKTTPAPKKTPPPLSIVIPSVINKNPAAIKMKCTIKNTSKLFTSVGVMITHTNVSPCQQSLACIQQIQKREIIARLGIKSFSTSLEV